MNFREFSIEPLALEQDTHELLAEDVSPLRRSLAYLLDGTGAGIHIQAIDY
jgi:hypothetical protein